MFHVVQYLGTLGSDVYWGCLQQHAACAHCASMWHAHKPGTDVLGSTREAGLAPWHGEQVPLPAARAEGGVKREERRR